MGQVLTAHRSLIVVAAGAPPRELRERVNSTLRGQEFRGDIQVYTNPSDGAFGEHIPRECSYCFFRTRTDCQIKGDIAKKTFKIAVTQNMPTQLDGKSIGNYCPHFVDMDAE